MLKIDTKKEEDKTVVALDGRLDTLTVRELEKVLPEILDGVKELIFDFAKLEYISSAGLRVFLYVINEMEDKGGLKVINASASIMEVLEVTGFTSDLKFE